MNERILGMGNALVDIIIKVDDKFIEDLGFKKGSMNHVDLATRDMILNKAKGNEIEKVTGGSVANSICGLAELDVKTAYIGKIGEDDNGNFFSEDMNRKKIRTFFKYGEAATGTAICMVTKDSERTFATYLGAAVELSAPDLNISDFNEADYFFLEGYMVQDHQLVKRSVELAKKANNKIILDLASFNVVEENRNFLLSIVEKYVDIIFANEDETASFTGSSDPDKGLEFISEICDVSIVKLGSKGSSVKSNGSFERINAENASPVDTTGAGDLFAAGFIYGIIKDLNIQKCARIGSKLAKEIVETFGAKISPERWKVLKSEIQNI